MRWFALLLLLLAACLPAPTPTPAPSRVAQAVTLIPPVRTISLIASPTPTIIIFFPISTASPTPTISAAPTDLPAALSVTATPPAVVAGEIADHYVFARPISNQYTSWVSRVYPYGGTDGGRLQVHHGDDLINPTGTPILAAADGLVIYSGNDLTTLFGPQNNYYGNLVVIQHNFLSPDGLPVFTLYGHMLQPLVNAGAMVHQGQTIGLVGATGIALGPHLHFEVRLGNPFSFGATRNPELWLRPYAGDGTLAGRVTDANGHLLDGVTLTVQSGTATRTVDSYGDDSVNGDLIFGENYVLGDLPADTYSVTVVDSDGLLRFQQTVTITAGRTNWLDVQLSP